MRTPRRECVLSVREHDSIEVSDQDSKFLEKLVPNILKFRRGSVCAANYVGVLTLPSGTVLEILPKIPMTCGNEESWEQTVRIFLKMLRCFSGTPKVHETSKILALRNFNMLAYFIRQFLISLTQLVHEGLARQYVTRQDNLPYLRGRVVFHEHIRLNLVNRSRVYSSFGELSVNRPVNRLIVTTLNCLEGRVGYGVNRKLLKDLRIMFSDVPPSQNIVADWQAHSIDRSMPQYKEVIKWIGLFLFGHGLATYSGKHTNIGLLFPMEAIFEEFVCESIHKHAAGFQVCTQGPRQSLMQLNDMLMFNMKPDITLWRRNKLLYLLDTKWKVLDRTNTRDNFQISQSDLYQLYTYGKQYSSKTLVLIYPMSPIFKEPLSFEYADGPPLICFPFDVDDAKTSVDRLLSELDAQNGS